MPLGDWIYKETATTREELSPADQEVFDLAYQTVQYSHDHPEVSPDSICMLWDVVDIPHNMIRWMALEQWGKDHPR